MSNLAGMNLALSRLNNGVNINTLYVDTIDGKKTVAFLVKFYNECIVEKQKRENKKKEIVKKLDKISKVVKGES